MSVFKNVYLDHQLKRWTAPNAHHFVRPDWRRYVQADSDLYPVFELYEQKYRKDQLRDDHGRFAYEGRDKPSRVRLASSEKPTLGRASRVAVAVEMAKRAMEVFRSANGLRDLFGRNEGTLAYTEINGKGIYGANSTSAAYEKSDRLAADAMRDSLIRDFPEYFDKENLGEMPNNAIYHAETTALLRAARENGGSLKGQELVVTVDKPMCKDCRAVLPYVGIELDNPTVTFVGLNGEHRTMRDGRWVSRR